jgi:hypothetical protein
MDEMNTLTIVIVIIAALAVIILLVLKNKKDKKEINPDANDVLDEQRMDDDRNNDRL